MVNLRKKLQVQCKSFVGCRRLATAVLQCYYDDKKRKIEAIKRYKEKVDNLPSTTTDVNRAKCKAVLDRLEYELSVYESFETSKLYDLYYGFIEERIDKNIIPSDDKVFYL